MVRLLPELKKIYPALNTGMPGLNPPTPFSKQASINDSITPSAPMTEYA
jgi:hypothetical protein